ncbi:MAG: signal peptidase I [Pirellulaceae bacterium]
MALTILVVALLLGLVVMLIVLWASFLRLGLLWARVPDVTLRGVVAATALFLAVRLLLYLVFRLAAPTSEGLQVFASLVELATSVLTPCLVIMLVFKTRFLRSVQAWLPTLAPSIAAIGFSLFVLRPFLFEAFVAPTNGMAPTLLGDHWRSECPECGAPNYCSPMETAYGRDFAPPRICDNFHVAHGEDSEFVDFVDQVDQPVQPADRFLVAKFLPPRRWDLVVFRYPEDPTQLYVKRLVGLPGETIVIEDGSVFADGEKLTVPPELRGIEYLSEIPELQFDFLHEGLSGSKASPAVLGDDEYFVLGDFSARSSDSRLWRQGAPGHPPYAVPRSYVEGVVTHIYWPPERCRRFR